MTVLLFDVGNSRCKWAWLEDNSWLHQGVFDNVDAAAWQNLKTVFSAMEAPEKIIASNVAGENMAAKLRELYSVWACPVQIVVAQPLQCGVRNLYQDPAQLGSDRWAALIGAWKHFHNACIVVNCGTATTIDALSATGEFLGGIILPGIKLMQTSLLNNTAQLVQQNGKVHDFPKNTSDAILTGVIRATTGVIQHQYALLSAENNVHCIISGGAAIDLLAHIDLQCEHMDKLVLQGLHFIAQDCLVNNE
jgi:type III pantothenate kinase